MSTMPTSAFLEVDLKTLWVFAEGGNDITAGAVSMDQLQWH